MIEIFSTHSSQPFLIIYSTAKHTSSAFKLAPVSFNSRVSIQLW